MSALRRLSSLQARLLLGLFACAMLVQAMVPVGWMPVTDAGGFRIVPCSGTGPMPSPFAAKPVAPMDHAMPGMHHGSGSHGRDDAGHQNPGADHPCAFAGVTPAIDAPAMIVSLPPILVRQTPAPVRARAAIGHGLAAPPPPQTGPPAFA